ncbi:MAG TPA: DUF1751 domain-containing protein [Myxococcaceae bacterium]|jgi:membrane associated rhomboid family serine protease
MPPSSRRRVSFELPSFRTVSAKLAVAFVAVSVAGWLLYKQTGVALHLVPSSVLTDLTLWQLVTFIPIEYSPMGILFGCLIIWSMGGYLESWWGPRRMFTVLATVMVLAGVVTVAGAFFIRPLRNTAFTGGWALAGAIWVLYGLHIGRGEANFWGVPMSGNALAAVGAGLVALGAVFNGPEHVVPDALALGFCWAYMRGLTPRKLWIHAQSAWMERQLRRRSKRLRMVTGERNMRSDSDRYLH